MWKSFKWNMKCCSFYFNNLTCKYFLYKQEGEVGHFSSRRLSLTRLDEDLLFLSGSGWGKCAVQDESSIFLMCFSWKLIHMEKWFSVIPTIWVFGMVIAWQCWSIWSWSNGSAAVVGSCWYCEYMRDRSILIWARWRFLTASFMLTSVWGLSSELIGYWYDRKHRTGWVEDLSACAMSSFRTELWICPPLEVQQHLDELNMNTD